MALVLAFFDALVGWHTIYYDICKYWMFNFKKHKDMALVKYYRPEFPFGGFSRVWDKLFEDFAPVIDKPVFEPQVDIAESEKNFTIQLNVPGIKKKDIKIELEDNKLIISGERKTMDSDVTVTYHRLQSSYGKFSQTFYLPENVDKNSIKASHEDGVLNVVIAKKEKKENKLLIDVK